MRPIAVTGLGVMSAMGIGSEVFFAGLLDGRASFHRASFEHRGVARHAAAFIDEFDAAPYLGSRGLRTFPRETKILLTAASMAWDAARQGAGAPAIDPRTIGVCVATTTAGLDAYAQFYRDALEYGIDRVNASLGPQTGFNAPAAQLAIWFGFEGPNITLNAGLTSSVAALDHAATVIDERRATIVLAAGLDTIGSVATDAARALTAEEPCSSPRPYDVARKHAVLGEAGVVLAVEDVDSALQRHARVFARIVGVGSAFDGSDATDALESSATRAIHEAMSHANIGPDAIDVIFGAANGHFALDAAEARTLARLFGEKPWICAIKGTTGECLGASGMLQTAAAVTALQQRRLPATRGLAAYDPDLPPLRITSQTIECALETALIVSLDPRGGSGALVLQS